MNQPSKKSYFSISSDLIVVGKKLPYDLFVNSSSHPQREHFVRIFPEGEVIDKITIQIFKNKYFRFYVPEEQRQKYLQGIVGNDSLSELKRTEIMKDKATEHLEKLFEFSESTQVNEEILISTVTACRESVECMMDLIKGKKVDDIYKLIAQLSFHDFYTFDHSVNVSMYCMGFAQQLFPDFDRKTLISIGLGGLLHDLGKLRVPTHILNKPDKLSDDEYNEIKKHPQHGMDLLEVVKASQGDTVDMNIIARIIFEHHENVNGTGYPNKITGDHIHPFAKLTAIVDFFDAITTHRSYHDALSIEEALNVMSKSKGGKIDESFFMAFVRLTSDMKIAKNYHSKLPDYFDPCQPHQKLPFEADKKKLEETKESNFGRVMMKVTPEQKGKKKVA